MTKPKSGSIPLPLVRTNQWTIVLSVLLTLFTGVYWFLLIPLISGLGGLFFQFNPVMRIAKTFLKKNPSEYIQEDQQQQNFNQVISVVCLAIAFISALLEFKILFYVFTIIVGLAAFVAILGFCVGCFIHFQYNQYKYRRSLK
ncbi:DUF4395 domain-containing protein [Gottfriedia solisilvae]|uniref:DUF4395 domain-containing protein n=1 Tax=Gottfriedia solisilvae TaxID=1516104 RepID=UPI003D2EB184